MKSMLRRAMVGPALLLGLAGMVVPVLAQDQVPPQPAIVAAAAVDAAAWSKSVWKAASAGQTDEVYTLLANPPPEAAEIRAEVAALKENLTARETRRAEQIAKIREELARLMAQDASDLSLSASLRAAVALRLLSTDKENFTKDAKIQDLIARAEKAAQSAEDRGDWLIASELYYRLNLLMEEEGTYKKDVARERRRLEMIRLYAPERFWELRNQRRNAEIEFNRKNRKEDPTAKAEGAPEDDNRPLPPYNPTGDDFRQKLAGVDEMLILRAIEQSQRNHVENTSMSSMIKDGLDAVRVLATTDDLAGVFPGLKDAAARDAFVRSVDEELARIERLQEGAALGDLQRAVARVNNENDKTIKLPKFAVMHEFGNGAMDALDEFSSIIWPDEVRRFQRTTQGRFFGVGVQIELDPLQNIRIVTPIEGTPAFKAGVRRGDIIKKVNGASTVGFTLDQAVDNITGPLDTPVTLTLEREITGEDGKPKTTEIELTLVRKEVPIYSVRGWKRSGPGEQDWDYFVDSTARIGYVRLSQFAERSSEDLDRAFDAMRAGGVRGIILDLRFNPGGLMEQAVEIANRFIDPAVENAFNGVIVSQHRKDAEMVSAERARRGRASLAGLPVAVLVNEGSASASEIVSGALQDYARVGAVNAIIVGQRSYGKGSVQNVWPLRTPSAQAMVKVTTNYYHLPSGRMVHRRPRAELWGVEPNFPVEMLAEQVADQLRQRSNADLFRDAPAQVNPDAKPEDRILDTSKPMAGPDLQLQHALVLLQSQVLAAGEPRLTERRGGAVDKP